MRRKVDYRIVLVLVSILGGVVVYTTEHTSIPKIEFSVNGYYKGTRGDRSDPRETYNKLRGSANEFDNSCITEAKVSSGGKMTSSNAVWIVEGEEFTDDLIANMVKVDGEEFTYKPYKDGGIILAPTTIVFKNSNVMQGSYDNISIHASINDEYTIEFNNIKAWFCHMDKDVQLHTEVVGYQGIAPEVSAGTVIGKANADTTVRLYHEEEGVITQVDLLEYFGE